MSKIKVSQRFGNWEVMDNTEIIINQYSAKAILCYDHILNELRYVRKCNLLNGQSRGSLGGNKKIPGHSTRYKHTHLPKYVYSYNNPASHKKFRVAYKRPRTNDVKTMGYFYTLKQAKDFAEVLY